MILIIILFFSYPNFSKNKLNYTVLGDKKIFSNNIISKNFSDLLYDEIKNKKEITYNKDFVLENIRIIDIINFIKENQKISDSTIQKILKDSNILIINVGNNELNYKLSKYDINTNNDKEIYLYLNQTLNDYADLLNLIRNYSDQTIIILGLYNDTNIKENDKYYKYINSKLKNKIKSNEIFIDTFDILNKNNDYITKTSPSYITNKGNLALFNKTYDKINNLYLHKPF